ncbi:hypothetical protein Rsub_11660 [Raphidocelis subcapitata]|uniref:Uncharacterized protein n=1 Tax=Raphidocelis subcapitata TaxID=307507 RepID=A0A2V0PFV0_9CHLO|nr:hypothetical protein Rsub_11660 [Raphidocelis subcapitata]|eukprot:GBF98666.1 hypothetical protein Rsub_11660 [Raphidocelis subcapitata]
MRRAALAVLLMAALAAGAQAAPAGAARKLLQAANGTPALLTRAQASVSSASARGNSASAGSDMVAGGASATASHGVVSVDASLDADLEDLKGGAHAAAYDGEVDFMSKDGNAWGIARPTKKQPAARAAEGVVAGKGALAALLDG